MNPSRFLAAFALVVMAAPVWAQASSQDAPPPESLVDPAYAHQAPYRPGEVHEFSVRFGVIPAGTARMEVSGPERVRGQEALRLDFFVEGGVPFARVDNRLSSWVVGSPIRSLRFVQDLNEVGTRRYRSFQIHPERGVSVLDHEDGTEEPLPTHLPLDDISFVYFVRTLPLEVGDRYVLPHYFRESGNPVVIEVLRRETISVPAGRYRTVVVRPTFRSSGLFGEGGEAEVFLSDDWSRVVVQVRSRVSRIGSLTLSLTEDPRLRRR